MGFTRAGQHKSKAVTLYRQGDIRLVVNTEPTGLAHSSYVMHGTSAYAVGLKVDDAATTMLRARKLGAQPFEQQPGKDEVMLPGIRGQRALFSRRQAGACRRLERGIQQN